MLAINRLCTPGSELSIEQSRYPATALDDLLHIGEGKLDDTRDKLLEHKPRVVELQAKDSRAQ